MIDFKNVSMVYEDGTVALNKINLHIGKGEFVFIIGKSGAGKTTLTKLLLREEFPSTGTITVDGQYIVNRIKDKKVPYYRRNLGVVFQDFKLFKNSTAYENVAFAMRCVGEKEKKIRARVPKLLQHVELEHRANSFPSQLSGGERQRVAFARALANNPKIIIADEPTANVDRSTSYTIMSSLFDYAKRRDKTVIVITHDMEFVEKFKRRVITIDDGVIVSDVGDGMGLNNADEGGFEA